MKVLINIFEFFLRSGSAILTSTVSLANPSIGVKLTSSTALLTGIASLITNELISKLKIRFTKLRDWIIVITLLCEKNLKQSLIDKKFMIKKHRL